ncbi:MAG: histidine phosphatase family protein, partial [Pseudomonadota bacterium]
ISRSYWFFGYAPTGVETHRQSWGRVAQIAARLSDAAQDGDVVLCAHGYLNWMIGRRLRSEGWRLVEHNGGNRYWSWRIYERGDAG